VSAALLRHRPQRVVHADWSIAPNKRWAARADFGPERRYVVGAPNLITPADLLAIAAEPSTLGFDVPIGVPSAYAERAGVTSFVELLPMLGVGAWSGFFNVARTKSEISLHRPFYPNGVGGTKREHLVAGLGLHSVDQLFRRCDAAQGRRACPIFWTLGANQVGKAALTGWREVLVPARATGLVDLWPFDGTFDELLARGRAVVVETYPGEVYPYIGATLPTTASGQGKRSRESRAASASGIFEWSRTAGIEILPGLKLELYGGFGPRSDGEDRFDAVVGLLGMLSVVQGSRDVGIPKSDEVQRIEGWILGRAAKECA
jgi:hypothetical protein